MLPLEQQVCSYQLAVKLRNLGVKQDSIFTWLKKPFKTHMRLNEDGSIYEDENGSTVLEKIDYEYILGSALAWNIKPEHVWSAYSVAELGALLPTILQDGITRLQLGWAQTIAENAKRRWKLCYCDPKTEYEERLYFEDENEANARAKMLIHLIESDLLKVAK